jgi:hypothetical protein
MEVAAAGPKYRGDKPVANFYKEFESRVARLPGVVAEDVVSVMPLTGWGGINVEGYAPPRGRSCKGIFASQARIIFGRWRFQFARAGCSPRMIRRINRKS